MRGLLALIALLLGVAPAGAQPRDEVLVFAAISLTEAMQDLAKLWESRGEARVRFNFAASSVLARQLDQGAAANVFASADQGWMDWAQAHGLVAEGTRRTLLGNRLVLVAPVGQVPQAVVIAPGLDLVGLLGPQGRLAVGDPASVPAGLYAKQALTRLGLWADVERRLARAENVRSALLLVERGEVRLGIVYATDAAVARGVAVVATFPAGLTEPIAYPFAVPRAGDTPAARRFMAFLAGPVAGAVFQRRGFVTE